MGAYNINRLNANERESLETILTIVMTMTKSLSVKVS